MKRTTANSWLEVLALVTYDDYFTYFLHLHLPHTAYPSHLRIIGHEGHEPTVNPTLLWDTPNQVVKHVGDARSVVVLVQAPLSRAAPYPFDLIWTVILNAVILKLTNLRIGFFYGSQACGLHWLLPRQRVDSTWDLLRTIYLGISRDQPPLV